MSLEYKFSIRENITNLQTYIVDTSTKSTKYFRVSDVPQVLQKGKNLLRITAHPTNLVPGTQIYVDVRDSNGNPIYYEIPDYLENDKSRVISIWIYNDKGDDNTPNGEATITLVGIANSDLDGNPLPSIHRNKLNVKWQTTVTVDRERNNTSEVIFDPTKTPTAIISQSVERYENQPQDTDNTLTETTQTGRVKYFFSGTTPIIQTISFAGGKMALNSEMAGGSIILNNFEEPAIPVATIEGAQSSTFFSSSIKEILNADTLQTETNFTTSFDNRPDVIHTYDFIKSADCEIQYVQSGSNLSTENKRNFANITLSDVDPITGLVDKIKVLHKSEGLPGGFELLNEVDVPFSSSFNIKIPIPSKNLNDPKIIKLLYLNSEGGISRTETISDPFIFDGDNLYIGGSENLISGSIFISNTLGTGIEIGGASSGFMRSVGYRGVISASAGKAPGGFIIYSGSGNLQVGEDVLPGVGMQFVGDNDARHLIFSTANGGLLDVKTDKFFIGNTNSQFISGSDGNIEISSSIFHLNPAANGGAGSLVIGANATILADLTVDNLRTPAVINGNASTETNSSSSIKADGFARFVSASIGGWGITTGSIEGGNLIMKPEGILQTRDFASGLKGWKISSEGNGTAEFENVRIRGTLRTTTFEKESVNAVGGQLWVANSTTITGSVTASETTMSVKNASGFAAGEILIIKKVDNTGFQTEYVLLNSASIDGDNSNEDETGGRIMIQRAYGSGTSGNFVGDLASAAQAYEDGQVIVSTGKLNSGYIKMNANPNDTDTPYMDIVERTGSGLYDVALKARLGDLKGLANSDYVFGDSNPGFGLATDNVFLQGGIIARTGSIGGIKMDAGKLFTGIHGTYANANTGFYVDSGSQFSLGNKLVWNPTSQALTIRGSLQLSDGTDVGTAIDNVSAGSLARSVELTADKYVITFDAFGNEAPSNQTITLTSSPQNFLGQAYYEYYKDGTIIGSRGTTTTFTVDTTLEKPTASTPVTYEVKAFNSASGGTVLSTDSLTLFGLQPGADGVDSVTAFLTNESHTLPLSSSGVIQSFGGADTQIKVFEGVTDKTANYTFTESSPAYITATSSSNTFTITNSTAPYSGSVTITAVSASVSLSKIMSIGISRQGDDGAAGTPGVSGDNAKTLIGSVDSQIFAFDDSTDNSATPGSITFAFSQQNLNDVIQSSDITITTADSNTVTNFSFDSNSVSGDAGQKSGIVSGSVSFTGNFSSGGLNNSKDSLPLTISCTNDTLTDSVTVFKVEGGLAGTDAVTAFLTNESHTFTSLNNGNIVSFAGGSTKMEVFEGITNVTNNYVISSSNGVGMTASDSGNTVTISAMAHDSGSLIINASSGSVDIDKIMSLTKSKQGTAGLPGSAAKMLTITSDSPVFSFPSSSSSTAIDDTIELIINQQNLSATVDVNDLVIKDSSGNPLTDPTLAPSSLTNNTGLVSGSITFSGTLSGDKTKLPLDITISQDGLTDSLKIFKVEGGGDGVNGTDAVSAFLTNESHTFPADFSGSIASFVGGSTDMEVFEGVTNSTSNYVISSSRGLGVVASDSGNTVTVTALGHDSGSVKITATSGSTVLSKTMSLTKARQGGDGSDGSSAKLLFGTLNSQVMAFDSASDSTSTPTFVEFSFQQQNLSAAIGSGDITIALNGGGNITGFGFDNSDVTNGTGIVSGSIRFGGANNAGGMGSNKEKFPVTISATKDGLQDAVKIFKVEGGADGAGGVDAITALLTNDSHTLPVSSSGNVISYAGASTDILVFQGTSDVTDNYTINTGSVSSHITTNTSGDKVTITNSTTPFSGSVVITATSASVSLSKTMSISQALQGDDGAPGANAKTLSVTADSQVFTFSSASNTTVPDDNTIEFFFSQQNLSGTIGSSDITVTGNDGGDITNNPSLSPSSLSGGSGVVSGSYVFATHLANDSGKFPCTVTVTKDGLTDSFKVFALSGGTDGVSALQYLLSNEAHIVPASSAGVVSSYTNSSTEIYVYEGTTELVYDGVGTSNGTWKINTPTVSPSGKITVGVLQDQGNYLLVKNHSAMDNSTDSVTISYPIVGKTADGTAFSFTKTQTITKSKEGSDGLPGTSASLISLTGDSQVFAFPSASATIPDDTTIELFITQQNLGKTLTASDITIVDAIGGNHTVPTFAPTSLSNNSGVISGSLVFNTNTPSPKAKFPITITATSESLSDSFKVFALDGGADGTSGTDAITVIVSNESHTLAADVNGLVSSFVGAETDVTIFEGVTDKTNNYFINGASSTGVTIDNDFNSFNSSSLNVTDMSHDSGSVIITSISGGIHHTGWGARAGENWATNQFTNSSTGDINGTDNDWVKLDNTFEISIGSGDGELRNNYVEFGNNANNDQAWIAGKDIFAYDDTKTYYIEARFKRVVGSGNVYIGVNGWQGQTTKRNRNGSNSFGSQHYIAANGFSFNDGQGTDWITMRGYFSGHSSTANNNNGEAPDINNPKSIHTNAAYISPMFLCTYPDSTGTVRLDYIEIKEVKDGSGNLSAGTVKVDKTMSLVKSRAGAQGNAGTNSKTVSLTAANNVIAYDANGANPSPSSTITLSANSQNFTNGYFKFTGDGITNETSYTDGDSANVDTFSFTVPSSYFSSPKTIRVGVAEQATSTTEEAFDTVSIVAVQPGASGTDAVTAFLTSEADVVPSTFDGNVTSFAGSGTTMKVFEGITDKSTGAGYTYTVSNSTGLSTSLSNNVLTITGLTPDSGSATITAQSSSNGSVVVDIDKIYSIGKSKAGEAGPSGSDNQDFGFLGAGLSSIATPLTGGLLLTSDVFGYHGPIAQGDGTNATLGDFTSFLDSSGNFYLGGGASGATDPSGGYFAWNNSPGVKSLLISGSNANIEVDKFFLGTGTSQYISGSNGNVEIAGDVTFRGRPDNGDGNVVFFDDFSQYSAAGAVDGGNNPKNDGTGQGFYFSKKPEVNLINDSDCISGQALQIGNNQNDDESTFLSNQLIPFNESSLYEIEVRIKRTAGTSNSKAYVGISGMQSDGTTKVGYDGADNLSGHYVTLQGNNLGTGSGTGYFQIFKGYLKGTGTDHHFHDSKTDPANVRSEILNGYIRAFFLLNYNDQSGRVLVDYIKIKEFTSGGTSRISGDSITTGVLKSNNLTTNAGSEFKLDTGTFKLGGTDAAHTKLEWDGTNLSVKGNITVTNAGDFADPLLVNDFPDSSNLYAYYPLHGKVISNAGYDRILDFSGNERHGDDTSGGVDGGAVSFHSGAVAGPLPGAIQFGGYSSRVELHTVAQSLTNNMNISLSFWIKKTNTTQGAVFGIHDGGQNDLVFFVDEGNQGNRVKLICANDNGTIDTGVEFTNQWRHIGLVCENGQVGKLYIDGVFIGNFPTSTCNTSALGDADEMIFGGELDTFNGSPTDAWIGYLGEFRIYNSVLTAANMQALYNLPTGIPSSTNISGDQISTGNLVSSNWSTTLGSNFDLDGGTFKLGGSSNPKLSWNGSTLAITGNITVANPNDFADPNADDSTTAAVFNKIISPTSQVLAADGRPAGFYAAYSNNVTTTIISTDLNDGNGKILDLYSSTDNAIGVASKAVETQDDVTYKIRITVKASTASSDGFYLRVYELDSLTGDDDTGTTVDFADGTLKAISQTSGVTGEDGVVARTRQISFHSSAPAGGTHFIDQSDGTSILDTENGPITTSYKTYEATYAPTSTCNLFSVNVLNWSQMSYNHIYIKDLQIIPIGVASGTTIGGDNIKTGTIKSINLSPSEGSIIALNDGTMKMGGVTNPGFEVTKEGFVTATNIVEKFVTITNVNSGSYYQDNSGKTRLVLDGSLGGSTTMNLTLAVAPPSSINDILFPANAGADDIAKLELSVQADGVQFENDSITSGYTSFGIFLQSLTLLPTGKQFSGS